MKNRHFLPLLICLWLFLVQDSTAELKYDSFSQTLSVKEPYSSCLHLVNNTSYEVENLIRWAGDYLKINNVTICVTHQNRPHEEDGFVIKEGNIYFIYLKKKIKNVDLILIHELIHIKQYESEDLVIVKPGVVNFRGKRINLSWLDYEIRPFEREAHEKDYKMLKEFRKYRKGG